MNNQTGQTWTLLKENGIVQGEEPTKKISASPWYVKMLLAFSGWLAAGFILGFIGAAFAFVFEHISVAFILGMTMIVSAYILLRASANEFIEHLGLAISMAGQALIAYAIFDISHHNEITTWLMLAVLQALLAALMPNFVHGVFSAMVAAIAFSMALHKMDIPYFIGGIIMFSASFCWLNEFRYPQQMKKMRAMGYGLVLALVTFKGTALFWYRTVNVLFPQKQELLTRPWLGEIIITMITLYVVWSLLQRYGQPVNGRLSMTVLLATLLVCAVSVHVQGITVGMVIVCLGFFGANRILLGLGIVSLLFYISTYYYMLDTTLLDKSRSLFLAGLIILFLRWLMKYMIPANNETPHE
ncbi:MAG: DUF4401 domain-containing protein [Candidatus Aureabacteria bacterium]|nr:DUF4401 domain-containing protein [Candidatus Auribacterota bacterium]